MPSPVASSLALGLALAASGGASLTGACLHHHGPFDFKVEDVAGHAARNARAPSPREQQFLAVPSNASAYANLKYLTSRPHVAGTDGDVHMAYWLRNQMQRYGLSDSRVEAVDVLLSYPQDRALELLDATTGRVEFTAPLSEPVLPEDETSDTWWRNHTFGGYAPSGDVQGELVYANFGRPEDFAVLAASGVDVRGKVVLTRYGECFRGLKAMNAAAAGAAAVLIYSDPQQDGFAVGKTFPKGPWRPEYSVQRGSMQYLSLCAGDPARAYLPGGVNATRAACGMDQDQLIPQIPVLPLSWGDAVPFLNALGGAAAPDNFTGALTAAQGLKDGVYRLGPSVGARARVFLNNTFDTTPVWNVVTKIQGQLTGAADRPVVLGNHRDAWVYGAADPNSGTAQLLEIARGLGQLVHSGWQPRRSIYLCSWSGEEYGLLGSTAWGELNADTLLANASVYLNVDVGVSGTKFSASGTPSLASVLAGALQEVRDPTTGEPLAATWDGDVMTLGSGSDYTVFIDHLGVPSLDMAFSPKEGHPYGTYHSVYDSFSWMAREGDPEFRYHVAMAQLWGLTALRLSEPLVLPLNLTLQADAIHGYSTTTSALAAAALGTGAVDFGPFDTAVANFRDAAAAAAAAAATTTSADSAADADDRVTFAERRFLSDAGLPGRKWFKHVLQAPGLYKGYDADALPAVVQAVRDGDAAEAQAQLAVAAGRVQAAADFVAGHRA